MALSCIILPSNIWQATLNYQGKGHLNLQIYSPQRILQRNKYSPGYIPDTIFHNLYYRKSGFLLVDKKTPNTNQLNKQKNLIT